MIATGLATIVEQQSAGCPSSPAAPRRCRVWRLNNSDELLQPPKSGTWDAAAAAHAEGPTLTAPRSTPCQRSRRCAVPNGRLRSNQANN